MPDTSTLTRMNETDDALSLAEASALSHRTSDALRALANEHRLLILALLAGTERSVGELETLLRLPQPAVSQQLARLRLDSLVHCRRDGRTMYYTAAEGRLSEIINDLDRLLDLKGLIERRAAAKAVEVVETLRHASHG